MVTYEEDKLVCSICVSQNSKIELEHFYNPAFVNGSSSYKRSALSGHERSETHKRAVVEQGHHEGVAAGKSIPKISKTIPDDAPIRVGFNRMLDNEKD